VLAAALVLDPRAASGSLPLHIEIHGDRLTLRNVTAITVPTYDADAQVPPLQRYLAALNAAAQRDEAPGGGGAVVTSPLVRRSVSISAPLLVTGTIGARHVHMILGGATHRLAVALPRGRVRLEVSPQPPFELLTPGRESGRRLLARATRASLEFSRSHQYDEFLGNPDPSGPSATTFVYASGRRPAAVSIDGASQAGRGWLHTVLIAAIALGAAAAGAVAWARS
jgi:hypothetical protein